MADEKAVQDRAATHNGHLTETEPARQEPKPEQKPDQEDEKPKPPLRDRARGFVRRHPMGIAIGAVALVAAVIAAIFLLRYLNSYESTDDAFIEGHLNPITPRIGGTVIGVHVENNQFVKAGQVLVELDSRDYQVALLQSRASYMQAAAQLQAEHPNVPITQTTVQTTISTGEADLSAAQAGVAAAQQDYEARLADVRQAEAQNNKAQSDLRRYASLVGKDEISRQQYDAAVAAAQTQAATVQAGKAAAEAAQKALDQRRAQLLQAQVRLSEAQTNAPRQIAVRRADVGTRAANVQAAQAQLAQAELNLSYTQILAPVSGVVTNRSAEVGQHLQPGETMLSVSQIDDLWITANFKETQLARMRPGQDVDIHVDAYNVTFKGYVEWMPGASGAATSLLPPENATGNFVKVVQRLPVRIRLKPGEDPQHRLRIGMSVEPKVWL
ncbi:MAG: HlyD family secretion protein [Acidobacteriia bacterium]|nr:HlyD family secretion protein [Terriglobia bacterium]